MVAEDQDQLTYTWAQQRAGPACALCGKDVVVEVRRALFFGSDRQVG